MEPEHNTITPSDPPDRPKPEETKPKPVYVGKAHPMDRFGCDEQGYIWLIPSGDHLMYRQFEPGSVAQMCLIIATYERRIPWQ